MIFLPLKEKVLFSQENSTFLVGVSLKDLAKPSKINGLQAAGKVLLFKNNLKSRIAPPE